MAGKGATDAKQRYITASEDLSIEAVASEFLGVRGCAAGSLARLSAKEKWPELRAEFRTNAQDKALSRMATKASYDVQRSLERTQAIADKAYAATQHIALWPKSFGEAASTFIRADEHTRKISGADPTLEVKLELGGLVDALKSGRG